MGENHRGAPPELPEQLLPPPVGEATPDDTAVLTEYFSEESLLVLGDWALALKDKKDALQARMQLEETILRPRDAAENAGPTIVLRFLNASPAAAQVLTSFSEANIAEDGLAEEDNRYAIADNLYQTYQRQKDRMTSLPPGELDYEVKRIGRSLHHNTVVANEAEEILERLQSLTPDQEEYDNVLKELVRKVGPMPVRFGMGPPMRHYIEGMMVMTKFAQLEHEEEGDIGRITARFVLEGVDPQYEAEATADDDPSKWKFGTLRELWRQQTRMKKLASEHSPYPRLAELQFVGRNLMDEQRSRLIADYLYSGRRALEAAEITRHEMEAEVEDTEFPYSMFDFNDNEDVDILMRLMALNHAPRAERLRNELTRFLTSFDAGIPPDYSYIRDGWSQLASPHDWQQRITRLRSEVKAGVAPRLGSYMDDVAGRYKALLGVIEGRKPRVRTTRRGRNPQPGSKSAPSTIEELTAAAFDELYSMRELVPEDRVADAPKGERIFDATEAALLSVLISGGWEVFNAAHRALKREYGQISTFAEFSLCTAIAENHSIASAAKFDVSDALRGVKDKIEQHDLRELKSKVEERQRSAALIALFKVWQPLIRRGVRLG